MKLLMVFTASSLLMTLGIAAKASDFYRLDLAIPYGVDIVSIAPVFDFDGDGCLPSAGISRTGQQNDGLNPSGSLTGGCRSANFLESSNTVHRHACETVNNTVYCGHFFALYFEKDQILSGIKSGHRHDWEHAAIWTTNGLVTHGSYSAHGDLFTKPKSQLPFQNGHLKIVYHKDGISTHAFRFAGNNEMAENPYGTFVTPLITSWFTMVGDGKSNADMRSLLNSFNYGSGNLPVKDSNFLNNLNAYRPAGYPTFTRDEDSFAGAEYVQFINNASGLCMDVDDAHMANGTNVIQWHCTGTPWQAWLYHSVTGEIRSKHNPRFCLDNSSVWDNGANIIIWECNGNNAQKFSVTRDGIVRIRTSQNQVLDGYGINPGDNIGTWGDWQGINQRWTLSP